MQIDLDFSGSVTDTMRQKIELSCKHYYDRCDLSLLQIFGCFCKAVEAIQGGRVIHTEHNGVWRLMVDGEMVESFKAHEVLNTFCY